MFFMDRLECDWNAIDLQRYEKLHAPEKPAVLSGPVSEKRQSAGPPVINDHRL